MLTLAPRNTRAGVGVGRKIGCEAGEAIRWGHLFSDEDLSPNVWARQQGRDSNGLNKFLSTRTDEVYGGDSGPLPSPLHL